MILQLEISPQRSKRVGSNNRVGGNFPQKINKRVGSNKAYKQVGKLSQKE